MNRLALLISLILAFGSAIARADRASLIEQGSQCYDEAVAAVTDDPTRARALFAEAAAAFDQAAAESPAPGAELYRAAGNAHLLAGAHGRAVLAFHRALRLDPSNRRAADGLAAARASINLEAPPSRLRHWLAVIDLWPRFVPVWMMLGVFASVWSCFWVVWLVARVRHRPAPVATLTTLGIVTAASGLSLLAHEWQQRHAREVVLMERAIGYNGPSADVYLPTFETPLLPGLEGLLIETRSGWSQVELRSGARTWVPESTVELVVPGSK
ncbi:MAG: hypothetical protein DYG94_06085 [Leptolyngbya sp. PLA3]|nr:MAG: hypothetical protein EDM82_03485 [Cyanobacteria bacterium CYA]MCE7968298.1 hypothetical protein [Leptolyngbya sp. PL-A3]